MLIYIKRDILGAKLIKSQDLGFKCRQVCIIYTILNVHRTQYWRGQFIEDLPGLNENVYKTSSCAHSMIGSLRDASLDLFTSRFSSTFSM